MDTAAQAPNFDQYSERILFYLQGFKTLTYEDLLVLLQLAQFKHLAASDVYIQENSTHRKNSSDSEGTHQSVFSQAKRGRSHDGTKLGGSDCSVAGYYSLQQAIPVYLSGYGGYGLTGN